MPSPEPKGGVCPTCRLDGGGTEGAGVLAFGMGVGKEGLARKVTSERGARPLSSWMGRLWGAAVLSLQGVRPRPQPRPLPPGKKPGDPGPRHLVSPCLPLPISEPALSSSTLKEKEKPPTFKPTLKTIVNTEYACKYTFSLAYQVFSVLGTPLQSVFKAHAFYLIAWSLPLN